MNRLPRLFALATLALAGCASTDLPTSGLLGDYSGFESRGPDLMVEELASPEELAGYRRIRIDRVHLYLEPDSPARDLPIGIQRSLAAHFRRALMAELETHYDLVQDLGLVTEDVLRVRLTLTDIQLADAEKGEVGTATVEIEVVDGVTGDRLAAAVARRPARRVTSSLEEGLAEADVLFEDWAANLRVWLDDVMGA